MEDAKVLADFLHVRVVHKRLKIICPMSVQCPSLRIKQEILRHPCDFDIDFLLQNSRYCESFTEHLPTQCTVQ